MKHSVDGSVTTDYPSYETGKLGLYLIPYTKIPSGSKTWTLSLKICQNF